MPKPTNAAIGAITCPICQAPAEVRKYKQRKKLDPDPSDTPSRWAGKLYIYCPTRCKKVAFENQDYILENATITGDAPPPPAPKPTPPPTGEDPLPPPPADPAPAPAPKPAPRKSKLEDWFL